ncbi:MAG: hypothetical protein KAV45_15575 [Calditrichia bacterium]|nr:hypothetical protein [Calditrichia bacterium]
MIDISIGDFWDIAKAIIGSAVFFGIIWFVARWKKKRDSNRIEDEKYIEYLNEDPERRFKAGFEVLSQLLMGLALVVFAFGILPSQTDVQASRDTWNFYFFAFYVFAFFGLIGFAFFLFWKVARRMKLLKFAWDNLGHSKEI